MGALGQISETSLTRETAFQMEQDGLPNSFVPGRNLLFFTFAAAVAWRRGIRHLVGGMCETDFSGYPDCRDNTIKTLQVALNLGMDRSFALQTPLMWLDKAETWSLAQSSAASRWSRSCSSTPTPAIATSADRARLGPWLRRMSRLRLAQARLRAMARDAWLMNPEPRMTLDRAQGRGPRLLPRLHGLHPRRELDDRPYRHDLRAPTGRAWCRSSRGARQGGPMMAPSGVSMIGLALVLRDLVQRRLGRVAALLAIVAGAALSGAVAPPAAGRGVDDGVLPVGACRLRGLHAAAEARAGDRGAGRAAWSA